MSAPNSPRNKSMWPVIAPLVAVAMAVLMWTAMAPAEEPVCAELPLEELWAGSGHADANAEAFIHWDGDGEVSASCAKCHSTGGYLDFLGEDGTAAGVVDNPAPLGTTVECYACHNESAAKMTSVVFPSGEEITGLGAEARCMQCHQGRESGVSVDNNIADANVPDDDTISSAIRFRNIHYYAASATLFGAEAHGGYQYAGKSYDHKFAHVEGIDTCIDCHNPHSLEIKEELCADCHAGDPHDYRMKGSTKDYDGDGNVAEGIAGEISTMQAALYAAMQSYAAAGGNPILYDSHSYPYFFNDTNGNGQIDEGEAVRTNGYSAWTARLAKAAFNYQMSLKDPGAFAHNAKYMIQLLYDSIEDMNPALVAGMTRDDAGHFDGASEAFRHWDGDGEVSASCAKCHSATGLPFLLEEGVIIKQETANGQLCSTCHDAVPGYTRHAVSSVEFPSGASLDTGDADSNLCINCHQGRESALSIDSMIAGLDPDAVSSKVRFRNVHYLPAGATFFGTEAKGAYEYPGKGYNGKWTDHPKSFNSCTECHDAHKLEVKVHSCAMCHGGISSVEDIRIDSTDYDGDGDNDEGLAHEVDAFVDALYVAIQNYAATVAGSPIVYDSHSYPYWFNDTNGNGVSDNGEATRSNGYSTWTPRLVQAAYNYQFAQKEPGAFAHNGKYIIQVLYDGLESFGALAANMVRPPADAAPPACGDAAHPYPVGDMNQDCVVDFLDIAIVLNHWLEDNNPQ